MSQEHQHPKQTEFDQGGYHHYVVEHPQNHAPHHHGMVLEPHHPINNGTQNESPEEGEYHSTQKKLNTENPYQIYGNVQTFQDDKENEHMAEEEGAINVDRNADLLDHVKDISQPENVQQILRQQDAMNYIADALGNNPDEEICNVPANEYEYKEEHALAEQNQQEEKAQMSGEEAEQEEALDEKLPQAEKSSSEGQTPLVGLDHLNQQPADPSPIEQYIAPQEEDFHSPKDFAEDNQDKLSDAVPQPIQENEGLILSAENQNDNVVDEQDQQEVIADQQFLPENSPQIEEYRVDQTEYANTHLNTQIQQDNQITEEQQVENVQEQEEKVDELDMQGFIDSVWDQYDIDGSGALDFVECKRFIIDILNNMAQAAEFNDTAFKAVFQHFDKDNSGTIDKNEMATFIQELLHILSQGVSFNEVVEQTPQVVEPEPVEEEVVPETTQTKKTQRGGKTSKKTKKDQTEEPATQKTKKSRKTTAKKSATVKIVPEEDQIEEKEVEDFAEIMQAEDIQESQVTKKSSKSKRTPKNVDVVPEFTEQEVAAGKESKASKVSRKSNKSTEKKGKESKSKAQAQETEGKQSKKRGRPSKKQQEAKIAIEASADDVLPVYGENESPAPVDESQEVLKMTQQLTEILDEADQNSPMKSPKAEIDDLQYLNQIEEKVEVEAKQPVQEQTISEQQVQQQETSPAQQSPSPYKVISEHQDVLIPEENLGEVVIPPHATQEQENVEDYYIQEDEEVQPQIIVENQDAYMEDEEKRSSQVKPTITGLDVDLEQSDDHSDKNKAVSEILNEVDNNVQPPVAEDVQEEFKDQIEENVEPVPTVIDQIGDYDEEEDGEFIPNSDDNVEEQDESLKDVSKITSEHFRLGNQDRMESQPMQDDNPMTTDNEVVFPIPTDADHADDEHSGAANTDGQQQEQDEEAKDFVEPVSADSPKKVRGRPRKYDKKEKDPNEPKRPPGRPKKERSEIQDNADQPKELSRSPSVKKSAKQDKEELKRKAEEEKRLEKERKDEQKRLEKLEKEKKKQEAEEQKRLEKERKKKEAEKEKKRLAEEEKKRQAAEAKRLAEEQKRQEKLEKERLKKEAAEKKRKEEEAARKAAEKKAAELAKKKAKEEAERKAAEALKKKQAEEAARKKAEKKAAEEAARKLAEKKAKEQAEKERKAKELAKKKEEEARRKAQEAAAREAERKRQEELEKKRKAAEKAAAELAKKKAEEAEAKRKAEEERKKKEQIRKQKEEMRKKIELAKKKAAEEEAKKREKEEQKKKQLAAEAAKQAKLLQARRDAKMKSKTMKTSKSKTKNLVDDGKKSVTRSHHNLGLGFGGWADFADGFAEDKQMHLGVSSSRVAGKRSHPVRGKVPPEVRNEPAVKRQKTESHASLPVGRASRHSPRKPSVVSEAPSTRRNPSMRNKSTALDVEGPAKPIRQQTEEPKGPQRIQTAKQSKSFGFFDEVDAETKSVRRTLEPPKKSSKRVEKSLSPVRKSNRRQPSEIDTQMSPKRSTRSPAQSPRRSKRGRVETPPKKTTKKEPVKEKPVSPRRTSRSTMMPPPAPVMKPKPAPVKTKEVETRTFKSGLMQYGNPFKNKASNLKTLIASAAKFAVLGNTKKDKKKLMEFKKADQTKAKNSKKPEPKKTAVKVTKKVISKGKKAVKKTVITRRVTRSRK